MKNKPFQNKIEVLRFISKNPNVKQIDIFNNENIEVNQSTTSTMLNELCVMGFIDFTMDGRQKVYFSTGLIEGIFNEND